MKQIQTNIENFASTEDPSDDKDIMARFHEECAAFGDSLYFRYDYGFRFYVRKGGF